MTTPTTAAAPAGTSARFCSVSPAKQPCRTCAAFLPQREGKPWCKELNDQVQPWWTGCIRWKPNAISGNQKESIHEEKG